MSATLKFTDQTGMKVVVGGVNDFIEYEDEGDPEQEKMPFWKKIFCCKICFSKKKVVHRMRKRNVTGVSDKPILKSKDELEAEAATKIQSLARRFLGKVKAKKKWDEAISDANEFWRKFALEQQEAINRRKRAIALRKQFTQRYVKDLIDTSVQFLVQTCASTNIQRVWRGYRSRCLNPWPKKVPRQPNRRIPRRHGLDVYRRMWARQSFLPHGGWPGQANFIEYDMWAHADKPPAGRDYGLKTHKVIAAPRSEKEQKILHTDKNAWVGLPVELSTLSSFRDEKLRREGRSLSVVAFALKISPYAQPVLPHLESAIAASVRPVVLSTKEKMQKLGWKKGQVYPPPTYGVPLGTNEMRPFDTSAADRERARGGPDKELTAAADAYFNKLSVAHPEVAVPAEVLFSGPLKVNHRSPNQTAEVEAGAHGAYENPLRTRGRDASGLLRVTPLRGARKPPSTLHFKNFTMSSDFLDANGGVNTASASFVKFAATRSTGKTRRRPLALIQKDAADGSSPSPTRSRTLIDRGSRRSRSNSPTHSPTRGSAFGQEGGRGEGAGTPVRLRSPIRMRNWLGNASAHVTGKDAPPHSAPPPRGLGNTVLSAASGFANLTHICSPNPSLVIVVVVAAGAVL